MRLHEKGGKEHEVPCNHNLERYRDEYIVAAGIREEFESPLFRTTTGGRRASLPATRCGSRTATA